MLFVDTTSSNYDEDSLHSLAQRFAVTIGQIALNLSTAKDNAENILEAMKLTALSKIALGGVATPPSEADINNARSFRELFYLLHIHQNWVDISFLEQLVDVSGNTTAAATLAKYKESHRSVISKELARLVDPSMDGTCPRPDASSCILQLVFKREDMWLQQVLACKDFLYNRFNVQPEGSKCISTLVGNSLVFTWLVSRCTGLSIMNQCRSLPVRAVLQEMEVLAVRLRYPGQLLSVEVGVSVL